jgi:hypothetical protein
MTARSTYPGFARPSWVVDWQSVDRDNGHQIDWSLVDEAYRETRGGVVTVGTGGAAQGATTVPVTALTFDLKAGTVLYFGGVKIATVTADAATGAVSITVAALPTALVAADAAQVSGSGKRTILSGTVMEIQSDGKMIPTQDASGGTAAHGLLIATAVEESRVAALSGHGLVIGGVVYDNLLPEAVGSPKVLPSGLKTALAAGSKGFVYRQYQDSRA